MKTTTALLALTMSLYAVAAIAQDQPQPRTGQSAMEQNSSGQTTPPPRPDAAGGHQPPPQAYEDCKGKKAGDAVQHTTREGKVAATCMDSPQGLVARPDRPNNERREEQRQDSRQENRRMPDQPGQDRPPQGAQSGGETKKYSLEQAVSDRAQLNTIAFDGLAFLTGDFGADTFLPPGKVSDYFGFQYMRDIDAKGGGHNTSFLTRIANNMLAILSDEQKAKLLALAREQEAGIKEFAEKRFPLIKAFRMHLESPSGGRGLNQEAVKRYSADLYALDGKLAYDRAKVMGGILRSLDDKQKAALGRLKFGDSGTWPDVPDQLDKRSMSHENNVAVMTYASEMFSWHAGSIDADTYFCPERHGMYFGGFGMKTAPAMGKKDYSISTTLTGNSGEAFLAALTDTQRREITSLVDRQRQSLTEIVSTRKSIATELRRFLEGTTADQAKVLALSKRYGELDGELSYLYATAFAKVGRTLSAGQKAELAKLRASNPSDPKGPFLYSTPVSLPAVADPSFLFQTK